MPNKDCSFFLKEPKATGPTLIYFHITLPDGKIKRSIQKKIIPADWDLTHQRASGSAKPAREINQVIDAIITTIPGVKSECRRNGRVISCADVHAALDVILQDTRAEKGKEAVKDMFQDFEEIIAGMRDGSILTPGKHKKKYTPATIKNYETRTLPKLQEFYKARKEQAVWSGVNIELYEDFISWCHEKDLSNNSIGVYIKCWKRAGKIAFKKGWHANAVFNDEDFMILKEETPDIYLDESKIERLYKQEVTIEHYDIARDWFVLDCYLGLRISDLKRVTDADFAGKHFEFVNQKTGAHVVIPIHPFVKAIIKKWKGLPPAISDQKLNLYIKEVAKLAKLNDKFIYTITKGGKLQSHTYEEWEMVSSHTCRRSIITNLLKMGIAHARVMKIVGIKRYETLQRYFKETPAEVAAEVGQHDFFKAK
jgi:site-specific recombinase XerD